MTFADKIRYDMLFQKVTHKGGKSEMNYIKRFQNQPDFSVSLGNSYCEDQLMHIFLDKFCQGGKYTAEIAIHQAELRREVKFTGPKILCITSLHTDYLYLYMSSGSVRNNEKENIFRQNALFLEELTIMQKIYKRIRKDKEKYCATGDSDRQWTERTPRKCFRCGSIYHLISKFLKPP